MPMQTTPGSGAYDRIMEKTRIIRELDAPSAIPDLSADTKRGFEQARLNQRRAKKMARLLRRLKREAQGDGWSQPSRQAIVVASDPVLNPETSFKPKPPKPKLCKHGVNKKFCVACQSTQNALRSGA